MGPEVDLNTIEIAVPGFNGNGLFLPVAVHPAHRD
jgi:hypothetical protein